MSNLKFNFSDRTAIVTGAARGIGLSIASKLANSGADVFMVDVDEDTLVDAASKVGGTPLTADITSSADVENVVAAAMASTGRVDILVNNAGVLRDRILWKLTDEDWEVVLAVHAGGTFRMTRACVPVFRAQRSGRVINVTSYTGLHGNTGQAAYATAKAGIVGFTKTVAKELARFGVTVNAISPNADTRMIASMPEEKRASFQSLIPLNRFAPPDEIAHGVAFLASDEAAYITGVVLPMDGGMSM
jgi:3-oxoacyl-[acyl-carrier protein] reductase